MFRATLSITSRACHPAASLPALVAATVVVSAVLSAFLVSQATAQQSEQPEPADPLEHYDANDNGVIDADEVIQATVDYVNGLIDGSLAYRVWLLFTSTLVTGQGWTQPCNDYDEDDSGVIERDEVLDAIDDYLFEESIDKATVLAVINCYYSGTHSIAISGLPDSLQSKGSQAFTVTASNLLTSNSYTIKVTTNHSSIGFDVGCSTRTKDYAVTVDTDNSDYSSRFTLYACSAPGGKVFAKLIMGDGVGELVSDSQGVMVNSSTPSPTPTPSPPSITIAAHDTVKNGVEEGVDVEFVLTLSPAPAASLDVNVGISEQGSFVKGTAPSRKRVSAGHTTARIVITTHEDGVDEAHGSISARVLTGDGYEVGDSSPASVPVRDNDTPSVPTGLRANGHLVGDKVTLRWNKVSGATAYNVRYIKEVCGPDGVCGADANDVWRTESNIATTGGTVKEAELEIENRTAKTLYRVEVQAVIVDSSAWSVFTLVFPTESPLGDGTEVATAPFHGYQAKNSHGSHEFRYVLCKETIPENLPVTIAKMMNAVDEWEDTVIWKGSGVNNIISTTIHVLPADEPCAFAAVPQGGRFEVKFVSNNRIKNACTPHRVVGKGPPACWRSSSWLREGIVLIESGAVLLNDQYKGGTVSWVDNNGSGNCTNLHEYIVHEVGHAFGIGEGRLDLFDLHQLNRHPINTTGSIMSYANTGEYCEPQVYDIVALMALYQSR